MTSIVVLAAFATALIALEISWRYTRLLRQRHRELLGTIRQHLADEWGEGGLR
jgi:hypothetical protein